MQVTVRTIKHLESNWAQHEHQDTRAHLIFMARCTPIQLRCFSLQPAILFLQRLNGLLFQLQCILQLMGLGDGIDTAWPMVYHASGARNTSVYLGKGYAGVHAGGHTPGSARAVPRLWSCPIG